MDCNRSLEFIPGAFKDISVPFSSNETKVELGNSTYYVTNKDQFNCPVNCSIMTLGCIDEIYTGIVYGDKEAPW